MRLEIGDVVNMPRPTIGAGPPDGKAIVIGFLVTHPDTNEVWMAWPQDKEEITSTSDVGNLTPDVIKRVLDGARVKFYTTLMSTASEFMKIITGDQGED